MSESRKNLLVNSQILQVLSEEGSLAKFTIAELSALWSFITRVSTDIAHELSKPVIIENGLVRYFECLESEFNQIRWIIRTELESRAPKDELEQRYVLQVIFNTELDTGVNLSELKVLFKRFLQ